jgi:Tfp pilus assembly protein PilX
MRHKRHNLRSRRGVTAMLAMLYLVLFSTLAIGFYAAVGTSVQVVGNERRTANAMLAAESGLQFMRYQLANVNIPQSTPDNQVIDQLVADLRYNLDGTANLGSHTVVRTGNTIYIPSADGWIDLDSRGSAFRATITEWAGDIVVKIDGRHGTSTSAARAITLDFARSEHTTQFDYFDFAIASRGQIRAEKGVVTSVAGDPRIARMMSAQPSFDSIVLSGAHIGGDLSIVNNGSVRINGGTVAGESSVSKILADHVHLSPAPDFPEVDTSPFREYDLTLFNPSAKEQSNVYIPPGSNVMFTGGETVKGILFIGAGSKVEFRGNFTLQGFIVMEGEGLLDFRGNVGMDTVPNQPEFDALRSVSGIAILAPEADLVMSGNSSSLRGNILVNTFRHAGAGTVRIEQGTLLTYSSSPSSAVFSSSKGVYFTATGSDNKPSAGVNISKDGYYSPKPGTYQEIAP